MQTQPERERDEMIARQQIRSDLVAMRDLLYRLGEMQKRIDEMLRELQEWAKQDDEQDDNLHG